MSIINYFYSKHAKENVFIMIIGNKCDNEECRAVSFEKGEKVSSF